MLQSALVTVLAPCSIKLLLVAATLTTLAELYAILAIGAAQPVHSAVTVRVMSRRILALYTQTAGMSMTQSISGRPLTDMRMDSGAIWTILLGY
jgi:hypothetical protein